MSEACQSSSEAATAASKVSTLEKENCKESQQLQTLKRMCNKIQEKEKNLSCYEISEKSGVFQAACKICDVKINLSPYSRKLYGLQQHIALQNHRLNLLFNFGDEAFAKNAFQKILDGVEPKTFLTISHCKASCRICELAFNFSPGQKNIISNLKQHLRGKKHKSNMQSVQSTNTGFKDISTFCVKRKLGSEDNQTPAKSI